MQEALVTAGLLLAGVLLLVLFVWSWRGSTGTARWWHHDARGSDGMAMGVIPGAGIILVAVAVLRVTPEPVRSLPVVVIVAGAVVVVVGSVVPRLWGPRWYRAYLAKQKRIARGK